MKVTITIDGDLASEFRYFWGKTVRGFDPRHYCIHCLVGDRYPAIAPGMASETVIDVAEGTLVYFCGVCHSFELSKNFHLAGTAQPGAEASLTTAAGTVFRVEGVERIAIRDEDARRLFPERGEEFLRCRNFQFAAQMFGTELESKA